MPRKRRYYNPWGQGGYEFDKWLYNLAPAEGQNAYQAEEAYNAYAKNSETGMQGGAQNYGEAGLQNTFQNMLSPAWEVERDNAQAAISETLHSNIANEIKSALGSNKVFELNKNTFDNRPWVKNNSNKIIYCKPENGGSAISVNPYANLNEPIDGVATHKYCLQVYKVIDGIKIEVNTDGDVITYYSTGEGDYIIKKYFGHQYKGGWKDYDWWMWVRQMEYKEKNILPENNQWNEIFHKATHICEH